MPKLAKIGDNNPPSDMDLLREEFALSEVENWLDGAKVENDGQMKAVDALIATVKAAEKTAKERKDAEYRPHKAAADEVVSRWKPVLADIERMRTGLLSIVGAYKQAKAAALDAERKAREAEAERLKREAEAVQRDVDMGDIEQRRAADQVALEARQASRAAADVEKVSGLRTFTVPEIVDPKACLNWIAKNDRQAVLEFMDAYVARKTREGVRGIEGVEVRQEKRAV